MVDRDVPRQCRKLGCVSEQFLQDSHSQLHGGWRILGLSNNSPAANLTFTVTDRRDWRHNNMRLLRNTGLRSTAPSNPLSLQKKHRKHVLKGMYLSTKKTGVQD